MAPSDSSEASRYKASQKGESRVEGDSHSREEGDDYHDEGEDMHTGGAHDNHHDSRRDSGGEGHHSPKHQPRRPLRSSSNSSFNSSKQGVPEVRYAKGILTPTIMDRGSSGDDDDGSSHSGVPSPKATSQYQLHPSYSGGGGGGGGGNGVNSNSYNGSPLPPHPPPHNHPYPNGGHPPYHYPYPPNGYPRYYDQYGQYGITSNTTTNGLDVRGEEVGIVIVVLLLWVGAIILFFNRWGKIRMLEPYQPKFCENHRPSCPMAEVTAISNHPRTFSKFNISTEMLAGSPHFVKCNYHGVPASDPAPGFSGLTTGGLIIPGPGFPSGGSTGMLSNHRNSIMMNHYHRPRQNSVFVTSPSSQVSSFYGSDTTLQSTSRKTKSAVDLPTLVLTGEFIDNVRRNSKNSITQL